MRKSDGYDLPFFPELYRLYDREVEAGEKVTPPGTVLSMVVPEIAKGGCDSSEEIRCSFCQLVHFFSSSERAAEWVSEKKRDIAILSVEVGQLAFEELHKYI